MQIIGWLVFKLASSYKCALTRIIDRLPITFGLWLCLLCMGIRVGWLLDADASGGPSREWVCRNSCIVGLGEKCG